MQKQSRKMVAPIIIAVLVALWYGFIVRVLLYLPVSTAIKAGIAVVPLGLIGAIGYVLFERIKEIRSGEEDDLSKY